MNYIKKIRNSKKWIKKRDQIRLRDNYFCQKCLFEKGIKKFGDDVHHIKKINLFPELAYNDNNLILLCRTCHRKVDKVLKVVDYQGELISIEKYLTIILNFNQEG